MSQRGDGFVKAWVSTNVQNVPGLDDYRELVADLASKLIADAASVGIGPDELDQTVGDVNDYLTNEYEQIRDPELGFKG